MKPYTESARILFKGMLPFVVFLMSLAACTGWGSTADRIVNPTEIYLPPAAAAPVAIPEDAPSRDASVAVQTEGHSAFLSGSCVNDLAFVEDQTIPDGMLVSPGEPLDKIWVVENSGACNWDERYRVKLVSGQAMGASLEQALFPARSGVRATIRLRLIAPLEPGAYRSAWQAFDPEDQPFGDPFFVEIEVGVSQP